MRFLGGVIRLFTLWLPAILLGVWGSVYLVSCVEWLLAPGSPVMVPLQTPGGEVRITAESYLLDPLRARGEVYGLEVRAGGRKLASSDQVSVAVLHPLDGERRVIVVHARRPYALARRLSDGSLEAQHFLPPATDEPPTLIAQVRLTDVLVDLEDLGGNAPFRRRVRSDEVLAEVVRDRWVASSEVDLGAEGRTRLFARGGPDGAVVEGNARSVAPTEILARLGEREVPVLREFQARNLTVSGPFALRMPKGKPVAVMARARATGVDVRWGRDVTAQEASFEGWVTEKGLQGRLDAADAGTVASLDGTLVWDGSFDLGGKLIAQAPSRRALPNLIRDQIPPEVSFQGARYEGWLAYADREGFVARGTLAAARAAYGDEAGQKLVAEVGADRTRATADLSQARWEGGPLTGWGSLEFSTGRVLARASTPERPIAPLAGRFGVPDLTGRAALDVLVRGSLDRPVAELRAQGAVRYRGAVSVAGDSQVRATWRPGTIDVLRGLFQGPAGTAVALGRVNLAEGRLGLTVQATGIGLEAIDPRARGAATFDGRLAGSLDRPQLAGRAQVFQAGTEEFRVPVAEGRISIDRSGARVSALQAVRDAGTVTGEAAVRFRDGALSGLLSLNGLQIADVAGEDFLGRIRAPEVTLGGTLDRPLATANVIADALILRGLRLEGGSADLRLEGDEVRLSNLALTGAGGRLTGAGSFDWRKQTGSGRVVASGLKFADLAADINADARLGGEFNGTATLAYDGQKLAVLGSGTVSDLAVNEELVGSGDWVAGWDGSVLTGAVKVGAPEQFVEIDNVRYVAADQGLSANLNVFDLPVENLLRSARRYLPEMEGTLRRQVDRVTGRLTLGAGVSGTVSDPSVEVRDLQLNALKLGEEVIGRIGRATPDMENPPVQITRRDGVWTVQDLFWIGNRGVATVRGTVDEDGDMNLAADLTNLDLRLLGQALPALEGYRGLITASAELTGPTRSPVVTGSVAATGVGVSAQDQGEGALSINLAPIRITETKVGPDGQRTGGLVAQGNVTYQGLSGNVEASIPVEYPFRVPGDAPLKATVELPPRALDDIARFVPALEAARTEGTLRGRLELSGTADAPALQGSIVGRADQVAFKGVRTTLDQTQAELAWDRGLMTLSVSAQQGASRVIDGSVQAKLPSLAEILDNPALVSQRDLLETGLQGRFLVSDLRVRGENVANGSVGDFSAQADVGLGGSLRSPLISGTIRADGVDILAPTEFATGTGTPEYAILPRFDLRLVAGPQTRIRAGTSELFVNGGGTLKGDLASPSVDMAMNVESGSVRLPTARIRLEPDGSLRLVYAPVGAFGGGGARLDVDLVGRTSLSAQRFDTVERYDITLGIRGDLLAQDGLQLTASSDPPDLSQDRILALLGQEELVQTLASSLAGQGGRNVQQALTGFALPVFFDPITSRLAESLGLEYLGFEYSTLDATNLAFSKVLGPGISLQGRRQVGAAEPGMRSRFELRLVYRPRFARRALNRFSFSAGLDQDRPWKVAVEYGLRFGNVGGGDPSRRTVISGPLPPRP